jgi:hypothetical protein
MAREHVRLRMDADLLQRVDAAAERENRTRSNMIEVLVRLGLIEQGSGSADDVFAALESVTVAGSADLAAAVKPTLDARRAEKPHRHRFQIEVAGTRRGKAGRQVADYACDCGQIKKEIPVR